MAPERARLSTHALGEAGINPDRVAGYQFEVGGHLEVAAAIATGQAHAGVTIRLGADVYGLDFIPHRDERYDLVFMADEADSMPVKAMLDALALTALRARNQPAMRLRHRANGPGRHFLISLFPLA